MERTHLPGHRTGREFYLERQSHDTVVAHGLDHVPLRAAADTSASHAQGNNDVRIAPHDVFQERRDGRPTPESQTAYP